MIGYRVDRKFVASGNLAFLSSSHIVPVASQSNVERPPAGSRVQSYGFGAYLVQLQLASAGLAIHPFNSRTQFDQPFINSGKTSINLANVLNGGFSLRTKSCNEHGHASPNVRTGHHSTG